MLSVNVYLFKNPIFTNRFISIEFDCFHNIIKSMHVGVYFSTKYTSDVCHAL